MREILKNRLKYNQKGVASIIVVTVLVVLLSLISVAFAKLMSRTLNNTSNRQQNSAANYAAQTGVNDVVGQIQKGLIATPLYRIDGCTDSHLNLTTDLSSDTRYSCNEIKSAPNEVDYQAIPPNRVQVVKLSTASTTSQILFSWQSTDRTKNSYPASAAGPNNLLNETTWNSNNYGPLLRLTLYPVYNSGVGIQHLITNSQTWSRTFFFYPVSSGGNSTYSYANPDGSLSGINCNNSMPFGFNLNPSYDCNVAVTSLSSFCSSSCLGINLVYFYAVISPIYSQADIKIQALNSSNSLTNFVDVQSVVDITGRSGNAAKRLQARVNTSQGASVDWIDTAVPDQAIRTAQTLCKRLRYDAALIPPVSLDSGSNACAMTLAP